MSENRHRVGYWDDYYAKHKELYKARAKAWRAANPRLHAHNALVSKYGMSMDEYEALLAKQKGVCAICSNPETRARKGKVYRLHIDHDHQTGRIRALLCHHCNAGLGHFRDDVETMAKALAYLRKKK
jgi:hypothetical protein